MRGLAVPTLLLAEAWSDRPVAAASAAQQGDDRWLLAAIMAAPLAWACLLLI